MGLRNLHEEVSASFPNIKDYDTAIPQGFWEGCMEKGFRPNGHMVWVYPERSSWGEPGPLTQDGLDFLEKHKMAFAKPEVLH